MKKQIILLSIATFLSFNATARDKIAIQEQKRIEKVKNHRKDMAQKHFLMADENKDKMVSKQEWQNFHNKKFVEMDANKDRNIDQKEFKAHHKKMRAKFEKGGRKDKVSKEASKK